MTTKTKSQRAIVDKALYGHKPDDSSKHSFSNGIHTVRAGFYYPGGRTSQNFADRTSATLTGAGIEHTILDHGEEWKTWRPGDNTKRGSHWWVTFKLN